MVAVLKSLELDEVLGGGTTQYREVCLHSFSKANSKLSTAFFPSWSAMVHCYYSQFFLYMSVCRSSSQSSVVPPYSNRVNRNMA